MPPNWGEIRAMALFVSIINWSKKFVAHYAMCMQSQVRNSQQKCKTSCKTEMIDWFVS